ncbi:MAG: hypothetical protein ABI378_02860 [Chitinophagaceae bacterium]
MTAILLNPSNLITACLSANNWAYNQAYSSSKNPTPGFGLAQAVNLAIATIKQFWIGM